MLRRKRRGRQDPKKVLEHVLECQECVLEALLRYDDVLDPMSNLYFKGFDFFRNKETQPGQKERWEEIRKKLPMTYAHESSSENNDEESVYDSDGYGNTRPVDLNLRERYY
ncbi:hypothetical protein ACRE_091240 [Hapsidospora chrysogenum ATCC 11550]|uniref:Uncharacterized protein n=1 Tax=Hapsidospora chrysogenum (strain ATCC 11550 / CBS 779.69 / DSM 880 / IAM 14645 / JCM 23072 / IMI 49137) TaxID=857340 RepID=A0A086SSY7_HAPC1|nr:hypothetical protein ACRE_091240 [Hapsidospora chrysogenum ATCC 11550]